MICIVSVCYGCVVSMLDCVVGDWGLVGRAMLGVELEKLYLGSEYIYI